MKKRLQPQKNAHTDYDPPESMQSVGIVRPKKMLVFDEKTPLKLESGRNFHPVEVQYETYGTLNSSRTNAIFVCHALTGSAHAAGWHKGPSEERAPGWWDAMIGPGKPLDTNRFFVICANFIGSCYGTTGPTSINPDTGKPYGRDFPVITVEDMVKVHYALVERLGIKSLAAVIGGSLGGMQAIEWATRYPGSCRSCIPIAAAPAVNAQAIAWDAIGRNAILNDLDYLNGRYLEKKVFPTGGLSIARMIGHITYLSDEGMNEKFGRKLRSRQAKGYDFESEFSVETYLDYQGKKFVDRFDANSYLYITKAMDYYDLEARNGSLNAAFRNVSARFLVISFTSDRLFPPYQSKLIVKALMNNDKDVSYVDIDSRYGHDAFLVEQNIMDDVLSSFLGSTV